MPRMMTPGETGYRTALRGLGERRYEYDTGLKADALRQAAQLAAQQRMADQQAEMQKWGMLAGGIGSLGGAALGAGIGALTTPSPTQGWDQQLDWRMKNKSRLAEAGFG